ncbi:AraC family transcriptional regulator, regulatory protein of adaptative response / methylated-DNA-(protein)-cysteine methyltransferase [Bosea sp. 62]|uniref:methylated-DNA--[protein]-cysteine S-methyltransferase n=1 Tax=unclassified Bosea (in: a-proteobacteria) TaxID=2653178 RepID=UPI001254DA6D|nr:MULTISPECIES: methylated-DNA--[protein]-cysteine S-methyltransferase [unclassified Bosea (in: a-proteobacteria)]CAD5295312.1 AraC family transcriptional regulator, regulatory protein of adaptative response / methylated-DNA-(protein)-cysteine methyltransferase [Bosea sp. 21B]CAD5295686.1 AraC family transcriptional regulator, regulatory protein of adaptative response / methylated-DNA-(protein)-cysteine methyltransferase [Bosea sp. 46]CAD5298208.1 AraC family transcriptional regulator, regulato
MNAHSSLRTAMKPIVVSNAVLARATEAIPSEADFPAVVPGSDYDTVRRILAYITNNWRQQPTIEAIADAAGATPTDVHHLFRRWCGLTPKAFLQAITLDNAKGLLAASASILDTSFEVGLSGPGRLHDLFVTHEAMSPGEWKTGGEGLRMSYGFHQSPFGEALVVVTERGLAGLGWVSNSLDGGKVIGGRAEALADMMRRWPHADYRFDPQSTAPYATRIFEPGSWSPQTPLRVVLIGTDFEVRVWETLLRIPVGCATTYGDVADHIGKPSAARAVGAAVGKNPISFVVPCHRVIGKSGALTGYHWGLTRKRAILGWEAGQVAGGEAA